MLYKSIEQKIIIYTVVFMTLGLGTLFTYDVSREVKELNILLREKLDMLGDSIVRSVQDIMLSGNARIANKWINNQKNIKEISSLNIVRVTGLEAFKDNTTLDIVNKNLGRKLFVRKGRAASQIISPNNPMFKKVLKTTGKVGFYEEVNGNNYYTQMTPIFNEHRCHKCHGGDHKVRGILIFSSSLNSINSRIVESKRNLIIFYSIILATFVAIQILFIRRFILTPIRQMEKGIRKVAKGDVDIDNITPFDISSKDELGELSSTIVDMIHKFKNSKDDLGKWNEELQEEIILKTRELQKSEKKYYNLFENANDAIFAIDVTTNKFIDINKQAEIITGYSKKELLGMEVYEIHTSDDFDDIKQLLSETVKKGTSSLENIQIKKKDNNNIISEIRSGCIKFDEKTIVHEIIRDISEKKELEDKLIQTEKLSAIGTMLANVAHELNNPLTGIMGYAQLLKSFDVNEGISEDTFKKGVDIILNESERCKRIVESILLTSRKQSHKYKEEYIDINAIVNNVLDITRFQFQAQNTILQVDLADSLPTVKGNSYEFTQAFFNIVINSYQALDGYNNECIVKIKTSKVNSFIKIEFTDTGQGINKEDLKKIFMPFFTTKEDSKGTGLGLSITYNIIEKFNGTIHVDSEPGKGTTFIVQLPIAESPEFKIKPKEIKPVEIKRDGLSDSKYILVIDDEEIILEFFSEILTREGHKVDLAGNAEIAEKFMLKHDYDLIISDIKMPKVSGMDLYEKIKSKKASLLNKYIFVTGAVDDRVSDFISRYNPVLLRKPLDIKILLSTVNNIINN